VNNRTLLAGLFCLIFVWTNSAIHADEMIQPRRLVESHTAGVLQRGYFDFGCGIYPAGNSALGAGLNFGISVGITNRLMIGLCYGGEGLVGRGKYAKFNPLPGPVIKYRLIEESLALPAFAIGYDHQGFGGIADTANFGYEGYIFKSPGFFVAISKNFLLFKKVQFGIHGSLNYSIESRNEVRWPNLTTGIDLGINEEFGLVAEYNFGFDTKDPVQGKPTRYALPGQGYLNLGVRWAFTENFYIEFDAKDVLEHRRRLDGRTVGWGREIKLVYVTHF